MFKFFFQISLLLVGIICLISCSAANNKPIQICFSKDSTAVVFAEIDPAGLLSIKNTPGIDTSFSEIISVLQTPADNDSTSMEMPVAGKIQLTDSTIIFRPLNAFISGRNYLVISYMNVQFASPSALLQGKANQGIKPQQVFLKR